MLIRNNTRNDVKILLNSKEIVFKSDTTTEVSEADGKFILAMNPMLCEAKIMVAEPAPVIAEPEKAEGVKNAGKSKKQRK